AAQEIATWPVQLSDTPAAGDAVHHTWANEIGPRATEAAGHADEAHGLGHLFPIAGTDIHPIRQMQPIVLGAQTNRGDLFAVASPLPPPPPATPQAALALEPVPVD